MPWNGSGTYSPPPASFPEVNGTVIDAGRYNPTITDAASGITNAIAKDGQNVPVANLPMGGFKHTGAADAAAAGQYAVYAQAISFKSVVVTDSTVVSNGLYLPAANTLGLSSNTTLRWSVNSTGSHTFAPPSSGDTLTIGAVAGSRMILAESSLNGQAAVIKLSNLSNTPSSDAVMLFSVDGTSAGDPYIRFDVAGTTTYVLGIDNSDSDKLVLSRTQVVGTNNVLEIGTGGNVALLAPSSGVTLSVAQAGSTAGLTVSAGLGDSADITVMGNGNGAASGLQLQQDASSNAYVANRANGTLNFSTNGSVRGQFAAAGGFTINTPTSGDTLTLSGLSGNRVLNAAASFNGSTVTARLANESNNPASDAMLLVGVAGSAAGDPYLRFNISGSQDWVLGADNDNSDAFTLSAGPVLGTTTVLTASTSRNVTINAPASGVALTVTGVANSAAVSATTGIKVGNSANTDTTVLDWYEEGSFTPGLSLTGSPAISVQTGRYVRIGNVVQFVLELRWTSGTNGASFLITNLPFTSNTVMSQPVAVALNKFNASFSWTDTPFAEVQPNTTTIALYYMQTLGTYGNILNPAAGTKDVWISGSYVLGT